MTKKIVKGYCEESKCAYDVYTASTLDEIKSTKQATAFIKYGEQTVNNTTVTLTYDDTEAANIDIGAIENSLGNTVTIKNPNLMLVKLSAFIKFGVSNNNTSVTVTICKKDEENSVTDLISNSFYTGTDNANGTIIIPNYIADVYGGDELFVKVTTNGNVTVESSSYFVVETLDFEKSYNDLEEEE